MILHAIPVPGASYAGFQGRNEYEPPSYRLEKNYPNPFNPSSRIRFDVPKNSKVSIKVYDLLGREVSVLVDNTQCEAGTYSVEFNASSFATGVYFYRISM
jgi:hypothetical protein